MHSQLNFFSYIWCLILTVDPRLDKPQNRLWSEWFEFIYLRQIHGRKIENLFWFFEKRFVKAYIVSIQTEKFVESDSSYQRW